MFPVDRFTPKTPKVLKTHKVWVIESVSYKESEARLLVCGFVMAWLLSSLATCLMMVLYANIMVSYQPKVNSDFHARKGKIFVQLNCANTQCSGNNF